MTEIATIQVGMTPTSPAEFIREEILNELALSVARATEILGVRRATSSDLVNGSAALSPEMALRIEKAFGLSTKTLLRMRASQDIHTMRKRDAEISVARLGIPSAKTRSAKTRSAKTSDSDVAPGSRFARPIAADQSLSGQVSRA